MKYAANRRRFLEEYAKENKFDALVAENWYPQSFKNIAAKKVNMHFFL